MKDFVIDSNLGFCIRQSNNLLVVEGDEKFDFIQRQFVNISFSHSDGVDFILHSQTCQFCQRVVNSMSDNSSFLYSYIFKKDTFEDLMPSKLFNPLYV